MTAMPDPFALCTRKKITVRGSIAKPQLMAWCFGDLAAHNRIDLSDIGRVIRRPDWGVTHLPSGMGFGYSFHNADRAVRAMLELARLKNTWAFITHEEGVELVPKIHDICRRYGTFAAFTAPRSKIENAPVMIENVPKLNGYEEEENAPQEV